MSIHFLRHQHIVNTLLAPLTTHDTLTNLPTRLGNLDAMSLALGSPGLTSNVWTR